MVKPLETAAYTCPSERQLKWQQTEFYALISYGMAVFNGKQYGNGFTPAKVFWPEDLDVDSWCETVRNAGMKGIVLTCKHYDGFCLWPTNQTDYSVKNSNWENGSGDLVKMVSDCCKKYDLKFGIYLACWDRHEKTYGTGKQYDDFFCGLLKELLTNYGDIFTVYLDGIIDSDEKRIQQYDWGRYYSIIRELSPDTVISFMGPDVRWNGNEKGFTRKNEWSVVPAYLGVSENGSSSSSPKNKLYLSSPDLGSKKVLKDTTEFIWYPCETSVPMRSHWFFEEDDKYSIKTKDKLLTLYFNTVGNNSSLMLGLSPNKRGVLDDTDTQILKAFGYDLKINFGFNILVNAELHFSSGNGAKDKLIDQTIISAWKPSDKDKNPEILIEFSEEQLFDKIVLGENIATGQHIEKFEIETLNNKGKFKCVYEGEAIGYKKICCLPPQKTKKIRIKFKSFRSFMDLSYLQIN